MVPSVFQNSRRNIARDHAFRTVGFRWRDGTSIFEGIVRSYELHAQGKFNLHVSYRRGSFCFSLGKKIQVSSFSTHDDQSKARVTVPTREARDNQGRERGVLGLSKGPFQRPPNGCRDLSLRDQEEDARRREADFSDT